MLTTGIYALAHFAVDLGCAFAVFSAICSVASEMALPKPTIPGRFSVPALFPRS